MTKLSFFAALAAMAGITGSNAHPTPRLRGKFFGRPSLRLVSGPFCVRVLRDLAGTKWRWPKKLRRQLRRAQ